MIRRFIEGDTGAQDSLHSTVNNLLDKAFEALSSKGSHFRDPDNVRQEIIVSVLLDNEHAVLRNFDGKSRLSTYLWSVIRFKLIDALRKEMLEANRTGDMPNDPAQDSRSYSTELFELINAYLNKMPERDAFILQKRWLQELSYDEICREAAQQNLHGIDRTYIGNLLFKARQKLIRHLKNHGYDFDKQMRKKI